MVRPPAVSTTRPSRVGPRQTQTQGEGMIGTVFLVLCSELADARLVSRFR